VEEPEVPTQTKPSSNIAKTCPLCDRRAESFIADHRGLPRHQLRNGYSCQCSGRFTVPIDEDFVLRQRSSSQREIVAQAVGRAWARGVTVNLDRPTFRRLLAEGTVA
jgi:hypothetical protein